MPSPGTLIALALGALALGACGEFGSAGDEELVTLFARETSVSGEPVDGSTDVLSTGNGAAAEALDPGDDLAAEQVVRIHRLRTEGQRLLLTVDLAERADVAQSEGGPASDPDTVFDLPAASDVAVTAPGHEGVGPAAVKDAVDRSPADPDGPAWTITVRDGEVVELGAQP